MSSSRNQRVPAEDLTETLLRDDPVWEFCNDDEAGETLVQPVKELPIATADGRLLACEFRLADGTKVFGEVGNLSLQDEKSNQHFLFVSIFVDGKVEHLARYHDVDYARNGPAALAAKLKKKMTEVFPISYDLSQIASGQPKCVKGNITSEPKVRLSRNELIKLTLG